MAKKWSEVSGSDGFKALSPDQKDVARRQYFDEVVAPQVPAEAVDAAWGQFSSETTTAQPKSAGSSLDQRRTRTEGRILDADIPDSTAGSVARDAVSGLLQIGPTALKGVGDIARLATGDRIGKGLSDFADRGTKSIQEVVGSERGQLQRKRFEQDMTDPALSAGDVVLGNPGALVDMVAPTLGSMAIPIGAAGVAGRLATTGKGAQVARAIDEATVLARADKARQAAAIGATVAQNAGDTYGTIRDAGGTQDKAYLGAGISGAASAVMGKLTGGGAEGQIAKAMSGKTAKGGFASVGQAMAKEGVQEAGEEAGAYAGEMVGKDEAFDPNAAAKRLAVAGTLGAAMGGGVDVATHAATLRQDQARIKALQDSGEEDVAKVMQTQLDKKLSAFSVDTEISAISAKAEDLRTPDFEAHYRQLRGTGAKPIESAGRAAISSAYSSLAANAGIPPKALAAAIEAAKGKSIDQLPGFLHRYTVALAAKGLAQPGAEAQLMEALEDSRNRAIDVAIGAQSDVRSVMQSILELEGAQEAASVTEPITQGQNQNVQNAAPGVTETQAQAAPVEAPSDAGTAASAVTGIPPAPGGSAPVEAAGVANESEMPGAVTSESTADRQVTTNNAANNDIPANQVLEAAAHEAATSPLNDRPEPTQAQKDAGNYKVGRVRIGGMDISIENPQGSTRKGTSPDGTAWETPMNHHYGYIRGTTANDGDKLDVFVKPDIASDYSGPVFVVDQIDPKSGKLDEHKVILGAADQAEAEAIYRSNYTKDWNGLGAITALPMPAFKAWAANGNKKHPLGQIKGTQDAGTVAPVDAVVERPVDQPGDNDSGSVGDGRPVLADTTGRNDDATGATVADGQQDAPVRTGEPKPAPALKIGTTPKNAEEVSIKGGVVHIGKYPAVDFESGEPVQLAEGASHAQIRDALKAAKALGAHQKLFGLVDDVQNAAPGTPAAQAQAAPVEAPADAGTAASAEAVPAATGGSAPVEAAGVTERKPARGSHLRTAANDKNPLIAFIAQHGLFHEKGKPNSLKAEFSPDKAIMVPGYPPVFRKTGQNLDLLTHRAIEDGFLPKDGTEQQLYGLIQRAIGGERIAPLRAEGVADDVGQKEMEARLKLEEADWDTLREQDAQWTEEFDDERAAIEAESDLPDIAFIALDDAVPWGVNSNADNETFLKALGLTDQEIKDAIAEESRVATKNRQGSTRPEETPASQAPGDHGQRGQAPGGSPRNTEAVSTPQTPADAGVSVSGVSIEPRADGTLAVSGPVQTKETDSGVAMYARGDGLDAFRASLSKLSAPPPVTDPKVIAQVQAWTDELSAKWENAPDIRVVASIADLPVKMSSDTRGLYYRGAVYVVGGRVSSKQAVGAVLAHESVAHYGLREMLGQDDWKRFMGNVQMAIKSGNKPLNAIRNEIRSIYVDESGKPNLPPDQEADEIAARVVEKAIDANGEFKPGFAFVKSVYAKIAQFLRDMGLDVQMTHLELQGALINAQRYLEAGQRTAGGGQMVVAAAREDAPMAAIGQSDLAKLFEQAKGPGNENRVVDVAKVNADQAETLKQAGISIDDTFVHTVDLSGIRHALNRHSDPGVEKSRAQVALTQQDFERISELVSAPDAYAVGPKSKRGLDLVGYIKRFSDGSTLYLEEVRTGKNRMAMLSMRKYPGTKDFDSIAQTLLSNARSDAGDVRIVYPERATGQYGNAPDSFGAPMAARGGPNTWSTPEPSKLDRIVYELQDAKVDLKRVQQAISKAGQTIEQKWNARLAETLYPGRVAHRADAFLQAEVKPLLSAMAGNNLTIDELADYLHARGAEERNIQIAKVNPSMPDGGAGKNTKGVLMTNAAARAYIAAINPTRLMVLDAMAKRVDAITSGTRSLLVTEGLEKQSTIDAWNGAYKHYVPMFRDEADDGFPSHPQGAGFAVKGSASKRATGSTKEVTNILAHVLMQREAAITRAEKNRVALSLYGMALSHPNPDFWATIKPGMPPAEVVSELQAMGVDPVVAQAGMEGVPTVRTVDPNTGKVIDRPNPMYKSLPGAIPLKVNGEDRVLMLNTTNERGTRLAESLKNLDGLTQLDLAGSLVGKATRWLASVNTQYNPAFGLVNFTRDTLGGAVNLGSTELRGKSLKVLAGSIPAIWGVARELSTNGASGKWPALYRKFVEDGGQTGYMDNFRDPNERALAIEKEIKALGRAKLSPSRAAHFALDLLEGFNTTLENAVRVSAYSAALDQGVSREEAARLGRELTVDFNRKGRATREIGPLYAFFNASVQGGARTIQTINGPTGAKVIAGGLSLGVIQAIMLAMAGYDDDEIPESVKTRSLIIPMNWTGAGDKKHILIPYPLGLHVIPNTARVLSELALNGGKDIGKRSVDAVGEIASAFNPLGGGNILTADGALKTVAPTVVDPLIELGFNRNFAGSPIEKQSFGGESDNRPGVARVKESTQKKLTGQAYISISKALNWASLGTEYEAGLVSPTPERVQYIAQVVGGGVLREFEKSINAADLASRGEKVKPNAIPALGKFYGEVDRDQVDVSRYYESARKIKAAESSIKAMKKAGDDAALDKFEKDHPEATLIREFNRVQRGVSALNREAVQTIGNPAEMKQIEADRLEIMRDLNLSVKELEQESGKTTLADKLKPWRQ